MECSICYAKSDEDDNQKTNGTFVVLPCEGTAHLPREQKHSMCFHCFVVNHASTRGICPVCRGNYVDFVRETHNVDVDVYGYEPTLADNFASQIDETEIIMRMHNNEFGQEEEEINIIDETFGQYD